PRQAGASIPTLPHQLRSLLRRLDRLVADNETVARGLKDPGEHVEPDAPTSIHVAAHGLRSHPVELGEPVLRDLGLLAEVREGGREGDVVEGDGAGHAHGVGATTSTRVTASTPPSPTAW